MNITLTQVRFLERSVRLFGPKTAVVCEGQRWTYSQFGERVERLANALLNMGIQHNERVAYLGYNCHRLLECYYGIVKMGGVLLPLNIRLAPQDFEYIIRDAEPGIVFVDPDFLNKLEPILENIPSVKRYYVLGPMENAPVGSTVHMMYSLRILQPHQGVRPVIIPFMKMIWPRSFTRAVPPVLPKGLC
jgi:fatty-acyl-CoA synthase